MLWTTIGGLSFAYWFMKQEWLDRLYPAPEEWSFFPKRAWRRAKLEHEEEIYGKSMVDWGLVGWGFRRVMLWCEMGSFLWSYVEYLPDNKDWESYDFPGFDKDIVRAQPVSDFEITRIGYDITAKSEPWRRAYFEAMMGFAEVAEMTEDHVRDKKRQFLFPKDQMIGPSNPYPKPIFPGSYEAPLEEDCEPCYDSPSLFYCRILTTKGLSDRQRMDAGLAYASYLDYKGDTTTAEALLKWCLNLACTSFTSTHPNTPISSILNPNTAIIAANAPLTTPNILTITTALARHYVLTNDIPRALGIYLSVLRARRSAPLAPPESQYKDIGPDLSLKSIASISNFLSSLMRTPTMDPAPPTGDEPFERTQYNACEEAALMTYVGEILFATAEPGSTAAGERRRNALSWTQDAVELAEMGHGDERLDGRSKFVCTQCLGTGLDNWTKMLKVLADEKEMRSSAGAGANSHVRNKNMRKEVLKPGFWADKAREEEEIRRRESASLWDWVPFAGAWSWGKKRDAMLEETDWRKELERVDSRRSVFLEERMMETLNRQISTTSKWFVA